MAPWRTLVVRSASPLGLHLSSELHASSPETWILCSQLLSVLLPRRAKSTSCDQTTFSLELPHVPLPEISRKGLHTLEGCGGAVLGKAVQTQEAGTSAANLITPCCVPEGA